MTSELAIPGICQTHSSFIQEQWEFPKTGNLIDLAFSLLKENTQVSSNQAKQSPKAAVDLLLKLESTL